MIIRIKVRAFCSGEEYSEHRTEGLGGCRPRKGGCSYREIERENIFFLDIIIF